MPSFDVVSEIDEVALRHAVENANREITTRFDFRGVESSIVQKEFVVTLKTESDFQARQLDDLFRTQCTKQGLSTVGVTMEEKPIHSGKTYSFNLTFKQGIDQPNAKELVKFLKDNKINVQASIQGDKLRVTGKKRDDLQVAIALLKKSEVKLPLQFNNFRD